MAEYSPQALRAIAQGLRAQTQLQGLESGPQMRQAINQMETPYGQVQGAGFAAEAPSLLNMIATTAMQRQGQEKVRGLDARAEALRGNIAAGALAQQQEAAAQAEMQRREREAARVRQNEAIAQREADNIRLRASLDKPTGPADSFNTLQMIDPTGKRVNVMFNKRSGEGFLDGVKIPNFSEYKEVERAGGGGGREYASVIKEALPNIETIKMAESVKKIANSFTPKDEADLNRAFAQVVKNKITPDSLKVYVDNNLLGLSPAAKKYLLAVESGAAQVRHHLSGAALTRFEALLNSAFLSNEPGLTLKDRMRRIGSVYDQAYNGLLSIDEATGKTEYSKKYQPWDEWSAPSENKGAKDEPPVDLQKLQQQLDALEKELSGAKVVD